MNDPSVQAALYAFAALVIFALIVAAGVVVIPIAAVGAAGWGIYKYARSREERGRVEALERTQLAQQPVAPPTDKFLDNFCRALAEDIKSRGRTPHWAVLFQLHQIAEKLYEDEGLTAAPPEPASNDELDIARWRDALKARAQRLSDTSLPGKIERVLLDAYRHFLEQVPPSAWQSFDELHTALDDDKNDPASVRLIDLMKEPRQAVHDFLCSFYSPEAIEGGLFKKLRGTLDTNLQEMSGSSSKLTMPDEFEGSPDELVRAYLHETPLAPLFLAKVPLRIPDRARMEHTCIVAGSGWGKTQLLQSIIASDLQSDDPPCLIVLDSTGAMIDRIQRLALFDDRLRDRILIIDPAHSPSLNMFDVSTPRFESYSAEQREDVQTEVIGLFSYVFDSADYELTANMRAPFQAAVRLMLSRPGSTISDLRQILEEPAPKTPGFAHSAFRADIERLDKETQDFFANHFFAPSLAASRTAIARRLHDLIGVPAIRRMFTASANTLDLFAEMQKGTIILVNTNQQLLKDDAMVLFGRFVIAKALSAALERATIPEQQRRPAYLIIDEAAPYFDETFEKLLTRVRQFKLGVVIAFQHLEQATDKLKSAIASSTSIKYAGGLGFSDRRWLAREMETAPEFIGAQKKDGGEPPKWTQFALYVRNFTQTAVSLTVPFYQLESLPKMSDEAHRRLLERNRQRVSAIAAPAVKTTPDEAPQVTPTPPKAPRAAAKPAAPQPDHSAPGDY